MPIQDFTTKDLESLRRKCSKARCKLNRSINELSVLLRSLMPVRRLVSVQSENSHHLVLSTAFSTRNLILQPPTLPRAAPSKMSNAPGSFHLNVSGRRYHIWEYDTYLTTHSKPPMYHSDHALYHTLYHALCRRCTTPAAHSTNRNRSIPELSNTKLPIARCRPSWKWLAAIGKRLKDDTLRN